jgi:hypothetical protein
MKFIKGVAWLVAFAIGIMIRGLVTMDLWEWFIVPLGVPSIGFGHALGLTLFLGFATYNYAVDERTQTERMLTALLMPLLAWCFGGAYYFLM